MSVVSNLFDVAMVFALALMVALVSRYNMTEMFSKDNFTMVKNPGKENMEIITKDGQKINRYTPSEDQSNKTMMAMMLALVSMCVAFSSCSSDDDNDIVVAAKEIAGSYTSTLDMTVMGQASTYDNVTLKIEAIDDATVKITLPACGEGMMALPALEVPAVKVSGSNGAYAFAQENYAGTVTVNGAEKKYTVTLQGTLKDKTLTVNYSVQYGKMPMPMIGKFVCTK